MNKNDRFNQLLQIYLSGNISIAEHEEFFDLLATNKYDSQLHQSIDGAFLENSSGPVADLPPHISQEIVRNIFGAEKMTAQVLPIKSRSGGVWWMAAASVLLIVIAVYFYANNDHNRTQTQFAELIPQSAIGKENLTGSPLQVVLEDGTTIMLQPGAVINYPQHFTANSREVYLRGDAFFQVAKNPLKPFLVYYNSIVTKVLGTSFFISTNHSTGNAEVSVKTGRVQVYENEKIVKANTAISSVIVTPNQSAIYQAEKRLLETALVADPGIIKSHDALAADKKEHFIYDRVELETIFNELEKSYGIEILVENSNLYNCVFTGDVSTPNLYNKLKIICLATNSTYEINGTKILIKGSGCIK